MNHRNQTKHTNSGRNITPHIYALSTPLFSCPSVYSFHSLAASYIYITCVASSKNQYKEDRTAIALASTMLARRLRLPDSAGPFTGVTLLPLRNFLSAMGRIRSLSACHSLSQPRTRPSVAKATDKA